VSNLPELPIHAVLKDVLDALHQRDEVVLEAPPGAGKTTIVPLALLDQSWLQHRILLLEPRRMAARAAAQRMADLLGESVGQRVGYRIRQETKVSAATRIEVVTGGVLTRLLQDDPGLSDYSAVIFDEFHERNLDTDLGLALTLEGRALLREADAPLKIVVMSATLDGASIATLLQDAPVVRSEGRMFPVEVTHLGNRARPQDPEWLTGVRDGVLQAATQHSGSLLVFLPGQREILNLQQELTGRLPEDTQIAPLYGNLSLEQQQTAINPPRPPYRRKVVLATDIAETSLTIEGVEVVVDSGLRREPAFDPRTGMTRLHTVRISQASATQRAGRAGRLGPGFCYRLWRADETLAPFAKAEIEQADLAPVALQMLAFGIVDPTALAWLTPPPAAAFAQALDLLESLGALQRTDAGMRLTAHGESIAAFPAHPRLAHMMLRGAALGLTKEACTLAAALEETGRPAFLGTDVARWVEVLLHDERAGRDKGLAAWAQRARQQIRQYRDCLPSASRSCAEVHSPYGLLLALAYPDRIARQRHKGKPLFQLSNGRGAALDEADPLAHQPWLAVAEVGGLAGRGDDRIFAAAELDPRLFDDELKEVVREEKVLEWDDSQQRFVAERRYKIGAITWRTETLTNVTAEEKQRALAQLIRRRGLDLLPWEDHHRQWQARVELLRQHLGDPWPDVSDPALLNTLENWLAPYLNDVRKLDDLRRLDLSAALATLLPWPLPQQLDDWAPTHIQVPSGSRIAIDYCQNPPVLAVKLQEMFGRETTPTVAKGKVPLLIHLLSPAQRPLQVTQDLAGFWRTSYHEVKKDMKGRYPKHPWPDDPLQATATRFTKNRSNS
jgi:ATP-dependent helicase HrpB